MNMDSEFDSKLLEFLLDKLEDWFGDPCGYVFHDCEPDHVLENERWCAESCDFNAKHKHCWRKLIETLYLHEHS